MSGATLTGLGGREAHRFTDDFIPQRSFGRRFAGEHNVNVADLRRRIDASHAAMPSRLPWAIGGAVICALSLALWADTFEVATTLARDLAQLF